LNNKIIAIITAVVLAETPVSPAFAAAQAPLAGKPDDLLGLRDFPPSPFDESPSDSTLTQTAREMQAAERRLDLNVVSTNQAEMLLLGEIKELKRRLGDLEAAVDANDPLLRIYERYIEKAHEWVMRNHLREYSAGLAYFGVRDPNASKSRNKEDMVHLIDMALYKDLASNTNFAPLLKSAFEAYASKSPNFTALHGISYARKDSLIGFHSVKPPKQVTTFETYVAEPEQRYDLVKAKLEQIQREQGIPAEVLVGWMYGDLYRMLDGSAQDYVELRTPEELRALRKQLLEKFVELSRVRIPPRANDR
jgi:hypothetical protein